MGWQAGYFTSSEFACKCGCGAGTDKQDIDFLLLVKLNNLRELMGPVVINSGARCRDHNQAEGGRPHSAHVCVPGQVPCRAVDIRVTDAGHKERLRAAIQKVGFRRRGEANTFIHVDVGQAADGYPQDVVWYYGR